MTVRYNFMRKLISVFFLVLAIQAAIAQPRVDDSMLRNVALALVASRYCNYTVDWRKLETAAAANGIFDYHWKQDGWHRRRIMLHMDDIISAIETRFGGAYSCETVLRAFDGPSIWNGIIRR
jgi:hypothetical protein